MTHPTQGPNPTEPQSPASARERFESRLVRRALRLSPRVQRAICGGRVVVDGLELDPQMQVLLRLMALSRQPPFERFAPPAARREANRQARAVHVALPVEEVRAVTVPGPACPLPAWLYVPEGATADLLVYLHGGGQVVGGHGTHDPTARFVARHGRMRVLMVDYRLAPEHRFPCAVDDAVAALRWARDHAPELGASPDRVSIGGDSAGGTLSAVVAQTLRGAEGPRSQWLIYPSTELYAKTPSRRLFAEGFFLTERQIAWYRAQYLGDADPTDVRASPGLNRDLAGVAPAVVVTAGYDPLRDEAEAYAANLAAAGVPTTLRRFDGLIHGFVNLCGVSSSAAEALAASVDLLRAAHDSAGAEPLAGATAARG